MRGFFLVLLLLTGTAKAETLRLVYPHFPPYTYATDMGSMAAGNFLLDKVMQQLEQDYQAKAVPNYKRALVEVEHGNADGFFLASQNQQRDQAAVFSKPLVYNNWSWFFRYERYLDPYDQAFIKQAKVASIEGTNTQRWLHKRGYHVVGKQTDVSKLARLLFDLNRIDAAFVSAEVFKNSASHPNLVSGEYIEVVQRSAPFGIYIAKSYLAKHPDFMQRLNQAIDVVQQRYLDSTWSLNSVNEHLSQE